LKPAGAAGLLVVIAFGLFFLGRPAGRTQRLPAGIVQLSRPIEVPPGSHDLELIGAPEGTVLQAAPDFSGEALVVCRSASNIRMRNFRILGAQAPLEERLGLPPYVPFAQFTRHNGILAENVRSLVLEDLDVAGVAGFAILASRCSDVSITRVHVADSGSLDERGRNNTTGGILLEEGTTGFRVVDCNLERIRGNGIWTHSYYSSPHHRNGLIARNRFATIGRDAIQVGHGMDVRVVANLGWRIGYPAEIVDVERGGTPVGVDTAGETAHCVYAGNRFYEVNGKCIDLDGFHDGEVRDNSCINGGTAAAYPSGNFGISLNNANPNMRPENIRIVGNTIDGALFGGIFAIGTGHTIAWNTLRNLNLAHCNGRSNMRCLFQPDEPDFLRSGIYLARRAERPAPAEGNRIVENEISGYGIDRHCIAAAPGVKIERNSISGNSCRSNQ